MEKPILFGESENKMVGILHTPECKTDYPKPAMVFCHGFKGDKVGPHRIFVKMARKLAQNGIIVFRFDCRGSGDSSGNFEETTISGQINGTLQAVKFISQLKDVNNSQLALLGLSLGGAIAACAAGRSQKIKNLVLWSAVADIQQVFLEQQPADDSLNKLEGNGYIDLDGFKLGKDFVEGIGEIDPVSELSNYKNSIFLVHGSEDEVVPVENTEMYYDAVCTKNCKKDIIVGADHTYNRYEWESQVLDKTLEWLIENL
jgi:hypothetical protein